MEEYLTYLLGSRLPFEPSVAALVWISLFLANQRVVGAARAANDAQRVIAIEDWNAVRGASDLKHLVAKILLTVIVFIFALLLGQWAFVFFVGGLIAAMAYGLALNVQALGSARAMARPNAVTGTLTFTTASALRHMAHRVGGAALACLLAGLVLAHLALLGGAFLLASAANGYLRKARKIGAKP